MNIDKAYDLWAAQYDTNENKTRDLDARATKETLSSYSFESVIELGCGTGKNTLWLLDKAKNIIGLDFSTEMLNLARKKITSPKVQFIQADLNDAWAIENEYADLITSSLTLEHIEDLDYIFQQAHDKLKEDGIFFISELHPFKQYAGSRARFNTGDGVQELQVFVHHISDYIDSAKKNNFQLLEIKEWFDDNEKANLPRLISFVFQKRI